MECVESNTKLLQRSLQGRTGRRGLGRSRSQDSPDTDRNHLPSISVALVQPFMENSKTRRVYPPALSSITSSNGSSDSSLRKQGKNFKLPSLLAPTTNSPVPSLSGTCHAPAMAGLHGMALKGAMAPPREITELLLHHLEEPQRDKEKRKHPTRGIIHRNLTHRISSKMPEGDDVYEGSFGTAGSPFSVIKALIHQFFLLRLLLRTVRESSLEQGAAQQRLERLAAKKSLQAWTSLQSKAERAGMSPSPYRAPGKLVSADDLENYKIRHTASTCAVTLGSLREDARGGGAWCVEHDEQAAAAQSYEWNSSIETFGRDLQLLEAQQRQRQRQQQQQHVFSESNFLRKGSFSPTPLRLPLLAEQKKTGRQEREVPIIEEPSDGDCITGWGQSLGHNSADMDSMEADLELLQVCASSTFRQAS